MNEVTDVGFLEKMLQEKLEEYIMILPFFTWCELLLIP